MRVLVTGATGLVGRHLVQSLEHTADVWALARDQAPSSTGAQWIGVDLAAPDFSSSLPSRADTVIHLAQSPHYHEFPEQAADVFAVNVASTARLLDWSRRVGVRRFVLASAGGVDREPYGGRGAYYLATKRSSELLAHAYRDCFTVIILRFFFVYGRGQRRSMLVPRLVDAVKDGRPITLAGRDGLRLNPVHVDDAGRAIERAAVLDASAVFDVAGPDVLTLRALGDVIARKTGRDAVYVADPAAEAVDLIGDIGPMSIHLAAPVRPFSSGIDDLL
jgi:UDP-glucose 4-epimerase